MSCPQILKIDPRDDVAVALHALAKGERVDAGDGSITLAEDIPPGHKLALRTIRKGETVHKYGYSIGYAQIDIPAGVWVHTHNLRTGLNEDSTYAYDPEKSRSPCSETFDTFEGFPRASGASGIRNEIWVIPTVGCVNKIAQRIADSARRCLRGSVGGVYAFSHPYGCSQMGHDQDTTRVFLANLAKNGNAGGVLFVSLGCENCGAGTIAPYLGEYDPARIRFLVCQEEDDEITAGVAAVDALIETASHDMRITLPLSRLVIGLNCGGSDGFSGISANPLLGCVCDRLTAQGAAAILAEVPEMFGAEQILMNRARSRSVFNDTVRLINDFKGYFRAHGQTVYENPSPGNHAGGITTLEEKSLGCIRKGGHAPVEGVLPYTGRACGGGLWLQSTPGNDLVSASAQAAAGAVLIAFTTGRGTPFCAPVPTIKIASNSALYTKKRHWMDFNAGALLDGGALEAHTQALYSHILEIASGKKVCAEDARDLAIFKDGVTL